MNLWTQDNMSGTSWSRGIDRRVSHWTEKYLSPGDVRKIIFQRREYKFNFRDDVVSPTLHFNYSHRDALLRAHSFKQLFSMGFCFDSRQIRLRLRFTSDSRPFFFFFSFFLSFFFFLNSTPLTKQPRFGNTNGNSCFP